MKVSELGEFRLIELIADIVAKSGTTSKNLLIGIGDDAAAWLGDDPIQLSTTDSLVQDIHFTLNTITWDELGWKALAINLSDIAAMGGIPRYALVSLALPGDIEVDSVAQFYHGMIGLARLFYVSIAGGNIVQAPLVAITLTVVGSAEQPSNILTRSAAVPGDHIAVTGYLGSSAGGLKMLRGGLELDQETTSFLRNAHLKPYPRVWEGKTLARLGIRAAIDLSDGLIADLSKLCQASGVGAQVRVDRLPVHPLLKAAFKSDYFSLALSGGEDYELLFTGDPVLIDKIGQAAQYPITVIGEIVNDEPGRVTLLDEKNRVIEWHQAGWEHFVSGGGMDGFS